MFWHLPLPQAVGSIDVMRDGVLMPGLPFNLDLAPICSALMLTGYMLRERLEQITYHTGYVLVAVVVFAVLNYRFDHSIDMSTRHIGYLPVVIPQLVLGIFLVFSFSSRISHYRSARLALAYLGSASMFILLFHAPVQSGVFSILSKFSDAKFINGMLGFVLGIVVPSVAFEVVKRQQHLAALFLPAKRAAIGEST